MNKIQCYFQKKKKLIINFFKYKYLDEIFSNYETNQVMSKSENICSGNVLNKMYDCKNGICTNMKCKFKYHFNQ